MEPQFLGIDNLKINKIGANQSQVSANVWLYNPNDYPLQLMQADILFMLDDRQAAHCVLDSTINIPQKDSFYIPVTAAVNLNSLFSNALKMLLNSKTKINADGFVKLKRSGFKFKVPVHYETYQSLDFLKQIN